MNKKGRGIGLGMFFIFIGVIAVMIHFDMLSIWGIFGFVRDNVSMLLAMLLILTGVNIVLRKYPFVKIISWGAFFAALALLIYNFNVNYSERNKEEIKSSYDTPFTVEKKLETKEGKLNVNIGGFKLKIGSTEANLVEGVIRDPDLKYEVDYKDGERVAKINFKSKSHKSVYGLNDILDSRSFALERQSEILINDDVVWDIKLDAGALESDMDLSQVKVKSLSLDGGAGSFKVVLGNKYPSTEVEIDTGASEIEFYVPKDSGVKLNIDGLVSSKDFTDIAFEKKGGHYYTPNYDEAVNKIEIKIDMGVGALKIKGVD